jgi:hypothetical protein
MMDHAVQDAANRIVRCVSSEKRWSPGLRSGQLEPAGSIGPFPLCHDAKIGADYLPEVLDGGRC